MISRPTYMIHVNAHMVDMEIIKSIYCDYMGKFDARHLGIEREVLQECWQSFSSDMGSHSLTFISNTNTRLISYEWTCYVIHLATRTNAYSSIKKQVILMWGDE